MMYFSNLKQRRTDWFKTLFRCFEFRWDVIFPPRGTIIILPPPCKGCGRLTHGPSPCSLTHASISVRGWIERCRRPFVNLQACTHSSLPPRVHYKPLNTWPSGRLKMADTVDMWGDTGLRVLPDKSLTALDRCDTWLFHEFAWLRFRTLD